MYVCMYVYIYISVCVCVCVCVCVLPAQGRVEWNAVINFGISSLIARKFLTKKHIYNLYILICNCWHRNAIRTDIPSLCVVIF
jgi:hypothetical protein